MSDLPLPPSRLPPSEAEATRWLICRRDPGFTPGDEREYRVWLNRDPAHRAAAQKVERYWQLMGLVGDDPEIMALTEQRARAANRPVRVLRWAALAAVLVGAIGLGWTLRDAPGVADVMQPIVAAVSSRQADTGPVYAQAFHTSVGQRTRVTLADGSEITLDTDSLMHTRESARARAIELLRGRAYFKVAKDPSRPFTVAAGGKVVVATGTEFAVDVLDDDMRVTLVEGSVRVETPRLLLPDAEVALQPGTQLLAKVDQSRTVTQEVDLDRAISWTSGRLHFFNETLGYAAREMNRYSEKKIVIRDPATAAQPIIGNFRAGDIDAFVRAVQLHGSARVHFQTDDVVALGPR